MDFPLTEIMLEDPDNGNVYPLQVSIEDKERAVTDPEYFGALLLCAKENYKPSTANSSNSSRSSPKERLTWEHNNTLALIAGVKNHFSDLSHHSRKKHVWLNIAKDLDDQCMNITAENCQRKWLNLVRTYKNVKENNQKTGRNSLRFSYFEYVDEILGGKPSINIQHSIESSEKPVTKVKKTFEHTRNDDKTTVVNRIYEEDVTNIKIEVNSPSGLKLQQRFNWQHNNTLALIASVKNHFCDLNHPIRRKDIWVHISKELEEQFINITAENCQRKWLNLVRTYRNVKENKRKTGRASLRFSYFKIIDEILSKKPSINNAHSVGTLEKPEIILSKIKFDTSNCDIINRKNVYTIPSSSNQKIFWEHNNTLSLIASVKDYLCDLSHPERKKLVWLHISRDLEELNINIPAENCRRKWLNLVRTYKKVKENKRKTGRASLRFSYYKNIDEILGKKTSTNSSHSVELLEIPETVVSDRIFDDTRDDTIDSDTINGINEMSDTINAVEMPKIETQDLILEDNFEGYVSNPRKRKNDAKIAFFKAKAKYYEEKQKEWERRREERLEKRNIMKEKLKNDKEKIQLFKEFIQLQKQQLVIQAKRSHSRSSFWNLHS